ncbi:MAG: hypothetical protein ACJ75S_09685 [Solirubrobacterales bacterium]
MFKVSRRGSGNRFASFIRSRGVAEPFGPERRLRWLALFTILLLTSSEWVIIGCGGDAGPASSKVLGANKMKQLLRQLPYRYTFRPVAKPKEAEAAVAGRAVGRHRTVVNFGVALGHGRYGVSVPHVGTRYSYGYPRDGFIFTNDTLIEEPDGSLAPNPKHHTAAQQNEASNMTVSMTDKLCIAATGEHCPS